AARVDDPRHLGATGGLDDIPCPLDVGAVEELRVGRPEPIVGRDMKERIAPIERPIERGAVGEIAARDLDGKLTEVSPVGPCTHQRAHLPAPRPQGPRHRRADEARRAGDERPHGGAAGAAARSSRGASAPARATAASERLAARYRHMSRMSAGRSAGARARAPRRRESLTEPEPAAAIAAFGSGSFAVSTIARTARKGSPCARATSATAALSMSTAAAPVSEKAIDLSGGSERAPGSQESPPGHGMTGRDRRGER